MIRKTKEKVIVCGQFIERIEYEIPYYWGFQSKCTPRNNVSENKERSDLSIARARQKLYRIILSNINEKQKNKNLFLTLTFKENMKDMKKANYEFKKFIQRFSFYMKKKLKYITVVEFQERGAIHFHTLLFDIPYIKDLPKIVNKLWNNGRIDIKPIINIRNISAYVSKYIRKGFFDKRLSKNKAYFCSRNCTYPEEWRDSKNIDRIMDRSKMKLSVSSYPSSKHGQIIKTTYKIL